MTGGIEVRRWVAAAAMAVALMVPALVAAPASAEQVVQHAYGGENFNGADSSGGEFGNRLKEINVNDETHMVYVTTTGCSSCGISQFDAAGHAKAFTNPLLGGTSTLPFPFSNAGGETIGYTTVDNSGGPTQGRIYVTSGERVFAFNPDGSSVAGFPIQVSNARGLAVNPKTHNLWVSYSGFQLGLNEYEPSGKATGREYSLGESGFIQNNMGIDGQGNFYIDQWLEGAKHIIKYNEAGELLYTLDPSSDGNDASVAVSQTTDNVYVGATIGGVRQIYEYNSAGTQIASFGTPTPGVTGVTAVGVDSSNDKVYVGSAEPSKRVDIFPTGGTLNIPGVTKGGVTDIVGPTATIHGNVDPDEVPTTNCEFEWGPNAFYGHVEPCAQGNVLTGSGYRDVSAPISGLSKGQTYHYRLIVTNANGTATGADGRFVASAAPIVTEQYVSEVHSDQALVHATINPEGVPTTYHVEYGTEPCASSTCQTTEELTVGTGTVPIEVSFRVTGLEDGIRYHYYVVATNQSGPTPGADSFFITFPTFENIVDPCENAHVRQQTAAALLLDCRAYELVSAGYTGGYNVESDLVAGQEPYDGYPEASSVLYAIHSGAIPGAGPAANRGRDPYIATRGSEGWTTKYVGVPSENAFSKEAFGSDLLEADPTLSTFAFGGPGICSPCFEDLSTNIPLRLPSGELVEGMGAAANPAGHVGRYLSADGEHLVFGTTTKLTSKGNSNGDVSIYERDLATDTTQLVSTNHAGSTLTGGGVAELDVSTDGSRVVVGSKISEDAAGNEYRHLYMHIGNSTESADLMPGAVDGALYDGMTADGSRVFFTTDDSLLPGEDSDGEADIYEAEVNSAGTVKLILISSGGGSAACEPAEEWNTQAGEENCDAMALAGGAGVATGDGTFYFLSPEHLDGANGILNQPNLYVVQPGGTPEFVATIDSTIGRPEPPPPNRPIVSKEFGGISGAAGMSGGADGDVYVLDNAKGTIVRVKANGSADNFTAPAAGGTNELPASFEGFYAGVAVDNSSGPFSGYFYQTPGGGGPVNVYAPSGEKVGSLSGFGEACGIAVDPNDGSVYVADYYGEITRFEPITNVGPVTNANYNRTGVTVPGFAATNATVDGQHNIYVGGEGSGVRKFSPAEFTAGFPVVTGGSFAPNGLSVAADPGNEEIVVDESEEGRASIYRPSGELIAHLGEGQLPNTRKVGFNLANHHVYVTAFHEGFKITEFGYEPVEFHLLANPTGRHAKLQPEVHTYSDFQVTPDGRYAAFPSPEAVTGFDSREHAEVFRYEPGGHGMVCASCSPTNARATGDSALPSNGLGLLEDGRVFFNSTESIAARDLDGKLDAYEWEDGAVQLISTGVSAFPSSLLGVDANGQNAYFFTRDSLVPQDNNGSLVKVYDAREKGGFPYIPPTVPCKASDECHGPSSQAPGPPDIGTIRGTSGGYLETGSATKKKKTCPKGKVLRGKKCVKKAHSKKSKKHRKTHRRNG